MGASVAALSLTAGQAWAQNVSLELDAFITGGIGFLEVDEDFGFDDDDDTDDINNVAIIRDSEFHVLGEIVSDNGLTFGLQIEVEAGDRDSTTVDRFELAPGAPDDEGPLVGEFTDADNDNVIDEASLFVAGQFGTFELGEQDGAQRFAGVGLVTPPFASAQDGGGLLFDFYNDQSGVSLDSTGANTSDDIKISYFTPNFSGFSAGVSYIPSTNDNGRGSALNPEINAIEAGLGYEGSFGGADIAAGFGYASDVGGPGVDDDQSWGGSLSGGFGGFILGVSYGWYEDQGAEDDGNTLGVGAGYGTGPWTVGVDYAVNLEGPEGFDDNQGVAVGASYALAPGVTTGATIEWADSDRELDDSDVDDSYAAGLWLGINF
jgi:hypothetical protein